MTQKQNLQVKVAKDVKKWINAKNVKSSNGYVMNGAQNACFLLEGSDSKQVAEVLKKHCEVCAKGALILSLVGLENQFDFFNANKSLYSNVKQTEINFNHSSIIKRLEDVWDRGTLDLIEKAFESGPSEKEDAKNGMKLEPNQPCYRAMYFGSKYKSDVTRLHKIMDNIIENDGAFKP